MVPQHAAVQPVYSMQPIKAYFVEWKIALSCCGGGQNLVGRLAGERKLQACEKQRTVVRLSVELVYIVLHGGQNDLQRIVDIISFLDADLLLLSRL